jgi:chloramphenicol-sensitive protein RarD
VTSDGRRLGLALGVAAYVAWGVVPLYWKLLVAIAPLELLAHRAVWGLGVFVALTVATGQGRALVSAARSRRQLAILAGTGALLAANWGLFIWATLTGHLLEASLGYFINPLVSVGLGVVFLRERLSRPAAIAIGLAAVGVAVMTVQVGLPWVALALAGSFGAYGLIRKIIAVPALVGSTLETALMAPVGVIYLALLAHRGDGALGHVDLATHALLAGTGVVTALPLTWFTVAARRLPLSTVGMLQYLAPTGQLVTAVAIFGEPLATARLAGFAFIWGGLALYTVALWRD